MADDRVFIVRSRVEKISRLERKRPSSLVLKPRITSVIHVTIRPRSTARLPSDDRDNKEKNNKSAIAQDLIKRSTSATRPVTVTRVHRSSSQRRENSWKSTDNSSQTDSNKKHDRLGTVKVAHQSTMKSSSTSKSNDVLHDTITNKPIPTNHIHSRKALGTVDDLTNPIHKQHHSTKNNMIKNLIKSCFRCSRRRALVSLCSLIIIVGILIAIILAILFTRPKTSANNSPSAAYLRWNTTGITLFGTTNSPGNTSNQFYNPFGLALDSFNDLYVADRKNNRIQKCRFATSTCTTVAGQANAVGGANMTDLNGPTYLYIDSNDNLYIADSGNFRVQFWNYGASYGKTVAGITGSSGSGLNQFTLPYGIALDSNSNTMYIADYNNNRVMKYLSGASSGTIAAGGNGSGTNSTQLYQPAGLYFDSSTNSLIIANYNANNIVRWVLDDTKWTIIVGDASGLNGNTSTLLNHPTGITFDPMGNLYVADMFNHRIQMYLVGQSNAMTIAGITGNIGSNSTMLNYPVALILDTQLNLYVTDLFNQRIQKFSRY